MYLTLTKAKQVPFHRNGTCLFGSKARTCARRALHGASKTPAVLPTDQPKDNQKNDCSDGGRCDCGAHTSTDSNAQSRKQPESYQRSNHANPDIADEAETPPPHDETGEPAGDQSNQQNDKQTFS